LIDGWLCERFHCLPSELDEQDNARLLPMVAALNFSNSVRRVGIDFLNSNGQSKPSEQDWKLYVAARDLAQKKDTP
jgi:hypothetical protein